LWRACPCRVRGCVTRRWTATRCTDLRRPRTGAGSAVLSSRVSILRPRRKPYGPSGTAGSLSMRSSRCTVCRVSCGATESACATSLISRGTLFLQSWACPTLYRCGSSGLGFNRSASGLMSRDSTVLCIARRRDHKACACASFAPSPQMSSPGWSRLRLPDGLSSLPHHLAAYARRSRHEPSCGNPARTGDSALWPGAGTSGRWRIDFRW